MTARPYSGETTGPLKKRVIDFVALSNESQAWEKVVLRGGRRMVFFGAQVTEGYQFIEVYVLSCNHFVHKPFGENWKTAPTNTCFEGLRERTCSSMIFAHASVRLVAGGSDPAWCPKVGREAGALLKGGSPRGTPMEGWIGDDKYGWLV